MEILKISEIIDAIAREPYLLRKNNFVLIQIIFWIAVYMSLSSLLLEKFLLF